MLTKFHLMPVRQFTIIHQTIMMTLVYYIKLSISFIIFGKLK